MLVGVAAPLAVTIDRALTWVAVAHRQQAVRHGHSIIVGVNAQRHGYSILDRC